jgi:hypothetical protein
MELRSSVQLSNAMAPSTPGAMTAMKMAYVSEEKLGPYKLSTAPAGTAAIS